MSDNLYYIQDKRTFVGNCMLFWREGGKGYTTKLNEAGKFTLEEAMSHRNTDVPWPCEMIDSIASLMVDAQRLPDSHQFKRLK